MPVDYELISSKFGKINEYRVTEARVRYLEITGVDSDDFELRSDRSIEIT